MAMHMPDLHAKNMKGLHVFAEVIAIAIEYEDHNKYRQREKTSYVYRMAQTCLFVRCCHPEVIDIFHMVLHWLGLKKSGD